jgi:putative transposase
LEQAYAEVGVRHHNSLYSPAVTMWLLVLQRIEGGAPMGAAVLELLRGLPSDFWPRPCKRIRDWREQGKEPSSHTGAYNQARQALPLQVVRQSCERIFQELMAQLKPSSAEPSPRAFILDGSSMRMAHSPELCRQYPPGANQHGEGHWPMLKVVVAHDLHTGLAMPPEWGPMYGPDAVSEQKLLETAIERLPAGSTVIGDANFGVFSVGWAAAQRQHPVVLRLTAVRAQKLAATTLHDGIDRTVVWTPSAHERKNHPELPADAQLKGRLIVRQVQPDNGGKPFLLALFTTLHGPPEEILQLYGQRWLIETDLRTLKSNLRLDQLTCATPDMVAKEIEMAMAAYNLVRAVTCRASEESGIPPRAYSFSQVQRIVRTFTPVLAAAETPREKKRIFDRMMHYVQQAKLPRRKRKRPSYPRAVWKRGAYFPTKK